MPSKRTLAITIYWLAFAAVYVLIAASYDGLSAGAVMLNLLRLPFLVILSLFVFHWVYGHQRLNAFAKIVLAIVGICAAVLLNRYLFGLLIFPVFFAETYTFEFWNRSILTGHLMVSVGALGGYGSVIYFFDRTEWKRKREQLIEEKKVAQLNFLRAQVNPHFLFNTLNGIYSEVLKKSDAAAELVLELSDLLRFILYECREEEILLETELAAIKKYIRLERMRYGDRLEVITDFPEKEQTKNLIPPLLLLPLVENAFKHGAGHQRGASFVHISVKAAAKEICLSIKNSTLETNQNLENREKGIGLENVRSQLEILFGDGYTLRQKVEHSIFHTQLNLPLS